MVIEEAKTGNPLSSPNHLLNASIILDLKLFFVEMNVKCVIIKVITIETIRERGAKSTIRGLSLNVYTW